MSSSPASGRVPGPRAETTQTRVERATTTADLLRRACETDGSARQRLLDEVVVMNMPVARSIAHRFRRKGVADDDLDQVAYMALTRAAQNFDDSQGRDFLSYAVPTIRGELKKYFRDSGWTVRPPRRVQELQSRIMSVRSHLTQELGRSPRPRELAAHLGEDLDDVVEALATDGCFSPASLDRPVGDTTSMTLGDALDGGTDDLSAADARLVLGPLLRRLSERDRKILTLRFFKDATQQEIADEIGVTQMHVSRLLSRILSDLHDGLEQPARETDHAVDART